MKAASPLAHLRVVLVRPEQPGNVGVVARALANHGITDLVIVDPPGFDPERARCMAPNAHDIINSARFTATVAEAVADRVVIIGTSGRARRWDWPLLSPRQLSEQRDPRPTAILFGPESSGLSNADMARCNAIISIPTAERRSLNLGQAVTVICAELLAGAQPLSAASGSPPGAPQADSRALTAVVQRMLSVLTQSGYMRGRPEEQVSGTLYRLIARARPTQSEANILLGMLDKLSRRVKRPG